MPSLPILDVAIGLIFIYLTLSLAVTATNEMMAALFRRRAWMLRKAIDNLLVDPALRDRFMAHPLIRSLYTPSGRVFSLPGLNKLRAPGPSYIPSRTFAAVVLSSMPAPAPTTAAGAASPGFPESGSTPTRDTLALLRRESNGDADELKANVEVWFNDSMERVSGWYKRRTQMFSLFWAVVLTIGTNADTIVIARALWSDPSLRQAVVQKAERVDRNRVGDAAEDDAVPPPSLPPDQQADADFAGAKEEREAAIQDLDELQLPLGWDEPVAANASEDAEIVSGLRLVKEDATDDWPGPIWPIWDRADWQRWIVALDQHLLGWLISIMAISLGAPFWFDMLNKVVSIRSSGKAPEEEQKAPRKVPTPREPGQPPASTTVVAVPVPGLRPSTGIDLTPP